MKTTFKLSFLASTLLASGLISAPVLAKVSQEEADKLGGSELTAVGAEVAGNADGTIPAYEGGMKGKPPCDKNDTFICNPFAKDKPKFVITAKNYMEYKDKLSPGQMAMFKTYPNTYKMPVYESRRTAFIPENIGKRTKENALNTEAVGNSGLKNLKIQGIPFPIPKSGVEAVWNHIARFKGDGAEAITGQVTPQKNGSYSMVMFRTTYATPPDLTDYKPSSNNNILSYFKQAVVSPARLAGNVLLVHETIDQVKEPRLAWVYNAGQRRVRRAPQVAYDGPGTASDGLRTSDNLDQYNGAPDRYNWTLKGKKEMFIAYNSNKLDERGLPYDNIVKPGHINQDLTRYELHRVWEVEGNLRKGTRHIYAKRVFFIDEDTWMISTSDHYDGRGNLWRVGEGHQQYNYNGQTQAYAIDTLYDLNAKRYIAGAFENNESKGVRYGGKFSSRQFSTSALRRSGVR